MNLFTTHRFLPLFITQFLGAINDNLFKNALVMLVTYKLAPATGENAQLLVTLAAALFILPYFLFSATAGQVADCYDRARVARATKIMEIVVVCIGAVGFYLNQPYFLLFVLFCLGVQATFFGPVKYALLPEHLHDDELLAGNGYIEAGTFLAILLGTIAGGILILKPNGEHLISIAMIVVAVFGYIASRFIPNAPASSATVKINWNIATETWKIIQHDRKNKRVFRVILAISWFWLVGATFLSQFPTYAKDVLHGDETVVTLLLMLFSIGIGFGSILCNKLLKGEIKGTFVPWAALGLALFAGDVYFASNLPEYQGEHLLTYIEFASQAVYWRISFDLFAFAACGGVFIVPLYAIMQHESEPEFRARTIATNNVINAFFMVLSAIATLLMLKFGYSVPQVFLATAIGNAIMAIYMFIKLRK